MVRSALVAVLLLLTAIPPAQAIVVDSVVSGSPAEAAGLEVGDRILRLDGREIANMDDLQEVMGAHQPGDTVPLAVERDGETVELSLTFGEGHGGGVSIGVSLNLAMEPGGEPTKGEVECLAWVDETYRISSLIRELGPELSEDYEMIRTCIGRDARHMTSANAIKFCDNVFKVHCSGLDLLTEIGESQIERCEGVLRESLGVRPNEYKGWRTCGQNRVFDRYSMDGETSDDDSCRAAFLDECGTNIAAAIKDRTVSPEQRGFAECCSADALGAENGSAAGDCRMIDDGFERGPCHDRPVCINRLTSEWIDCSVLD